MRINKWTIDYLNLSNVFVAYLTDVWATNDFLKKAQHFRKLQDAKDYVLKQICTPKTNFNQLNEDVCLADLTSQDYPLGGTIEPYDIDRENI